MKRSRFLTASAWVLAMAFLFITISACGGGGGQDSSQPGTQTGSSAGTLTLVARQSIDSGSTAGPFSADVSSGSGSLTIMANTGGSGSVGITKIVDPTGSVMLDTSAGVNNIGENLAADSGGSVATFTIPHSMDYTFNPGKWSFNISLSGGSTKDVDIYTIVKNGYGTSMNVNVWLVALNDYQGDGDPNLQTMIDEFKRLMGNFGVTVNTVNIRQLTGEQAESLTYLTDEPDSNNDDQSDDMDSLLRLSSQAGNDYASFFIVRNMGGDTLGQAGGIPGPQLLQGTAHSGVVVSALGGLSSMTSGDLKMQGATMAHELGHFLGLFHTTESDGQWFDPISDTPQCPVKAYDKNHDGEVSASECESVDGPNIMFWQSSDYTQETVSDMQSRVVRLAPAVQ